MEKRKIFWWLITVGIAMLLLLVAIKLIFKSDGVNEGKYRVSDVILTSQAEVENKTSVNNTWSIDLSQNNKLSMLMVAAEDSEIESIKLEDISASKGNVVIYQTGHENKLNITEENNQLDIEYKPDENGRILVELNILNENILKNYTVPEGTNEIVYDGRIFNTAGLGLKDIKFNISFKLVITEKTGKENVMKVKLTLPYEELLTEGASVRRLDLSGFKFKVK